MLYVSYKLLLDLKLNFNDLQTKKHSKLYVNTEHQSTHGKKYQNFRKSRPIPYEYGRRLIVVSTFLRRKF